MKEIIDEVGTTQEYVYKERGRMKREGFVGYPSEFINLKWERGNYTGQRPT